MPEPFRFRKYFRDFAWKKMGKCVYQQPSNTCISHIKPIVILYIYVMGEAHLGNYAKRLILFRARLLVSGRVN